MDKNEDLLGLYSKALRKSSLLTAEQEAEMSQEIRSIQERLFYKVLVLEPQAIIDTLPGRLSSADSNQAYQFYAENNKWWKLYTIGLKRNKQIYLKDDLQRWGEIKKEFAEANVRLVMRIAYGYHPNRLPLEELIAEGNVGLVKAIDRYDSNRGRFATFAADWIKQTIRNSLFKEKYKGIKINEKDEKLLRRIVREEKKYYQEQGKLPTAEELVQILDIDYGRYFELRSFREFHLNSLDMPNPSTEHAGLEQLKDGDKNNDQYRRLVLGELVEKLIGAAGHNDKNNEKGERNFAIFKARIGYNDDGTIVTPKTLEEIGNTHNLTKERIQQIYEAELRRLLANPEARNLHREFLELLSQE